MNKTLKLLWMCALLSLGMFTHVRAHAENPFPFVLPWDDASTDTGNATNLRALNHMPAGKYGPVTVGMDGHLFYGKEYHR